ncbi:MAG: DUF4372 domain-containing protein [Nitrosomonadales bacterium]|nr:DUF4372 domain-containing protein [Nitrosomonadales bacterium]
MGCADLFRVMAFSQLTWRESLRDIESCLASNQGKLFHMGLSGIPAMPACHHLVVVLLVKASARSVAVQFPYAHGRRRGFCRTSRLALSLVTTR